MSEQWKTIEEIGEARERFERALPGYRQPAAHALAPSQRDGEEISFVHVNVGSSYMPAVALATVVGYTSGSVSYTLTGADLGRALTQIAPAEACTAVEHPNLVAWKKLRESIGDDGRFTAVFIDDLAAAADSDDEYVRALLAEVTRKRATPSARC